MRGRIQKTILAAIMVVILLSLGNSSIKQDSMMSDRGLISEYNKTADWEYEDIQGNDEFTCAEINLPYGDYGARYYVCVWEYKYKGKKESLARCFIIKNAKVYEILYLDDRYETDFDRDGEKELVYWTDIGSGISYDTFYVIEKGNESVYVRTFYYAGLIEVNNDGDLIIQAMNEDSGFTEGKLAYREENGLKTLYIDTGEYTGHLYGWPDEPITFLGYESPV